MNFDFETAPGTNFEIDGVSALTGLSFSDLIPGTYSVVSDSAGVGLGTLIIDGFVINPGLNDAWYNPETDGQGFFITVFPNLSYVSLAWFTYDTEFPPIDATANLGDPAHRWLTAVGPIEGNKVLMNIEMTSGGIFDTPTEIQRTDPPGSDGTILLTFDSCNSGTVEYDITSINRELCLYNVLPMTTS